MVLCELTQLRNTQCNGVTFDLTGCDWVVAGVFPTSCSFPHAQTVKFGSQVLHEDAWAFASLCPQLRNLELSNSAPGSIYWNPVWIGSRLLTEVVLGACAFAKSDWLVRFLSELPQLEKLTLAGVPGLTLQRAINAACLCQSLKHLQLEALIMNWDVRLAARAGRRLSFLKISKIWQMSSDFLRDICCRVFPGTETVVIRGNCDVHDLSFLHHDTLALTLDAGCKILHPLDSLLFGAPLRLRTLQLLDWHADALLTEEAVQRFGQEATVHSQLTSLDISRPFYKSKVLEAMLGKVTKCFCSFFSSLLDS
jgi:hypothetical protein